VRDRGHAERAAGHREGTDAARSGEDSRRAGGGTGMNEHEHDRRLEEVAAFALGALDAGQIDDFKEHLKGCKRCQDELRWLAPAVRALPEAVEPQTPPPALKVRLMEEVRADAAAAAKASRGEERRERAASRRGFGEWLSGLHVGGL